MENIPKKEDDRCTCPAKHSLTCCCISLPGQGKMLSPYCPVCNERPMPSPDCPLHGGLACYPKEKH